MSATRRAQRRGDGFPYGFDAADDGGSMKVDLAFAELVATIVPREEFAL